MKWCEGVQQTDLTLHSIQHGVPANTVLNLPQ